MNSSYPKILKSVSVLLEQAQNPAVSDLVLHLVATRLDEVVRLVSYMHMKTPQEIPVEATATEKPKKRGRPAKATRTKRFMTPVEINQAKQLLAAGNSLNRVATILGRSISGLRYALEKEAKNG